MDSYQSRSRIVALYETEEELLQLFNDDFMKRHTNFATFEEFRFSGAVFVEWTADFVVGPREAFDCCVRGKTEFSEWEEMYAAACAEQKGEKQWQNQ